MWPFKQRGVPKLNPIVGQWRLGPDEHVARESYGDHAMTFSAHGELVHSTLSDGQPTGRILLVYRVDGSDLITDQPSAPREERTPYRLDGSTLLVGNPPAAMLFEPDYRADPLARALALATAALDHGLGSAHEGSAFVPFLMAQTKTARQLYRFVAGDAARARAGASRKFREIREPVEVCAWVHDGYLTIEDHKYDAVIAELSSVESPEGLLVAQPYVFDARSARRAAGMQTQANESWFVDHAAS
jgi:hypothetical protein